MSNFTKVIRDNYTDGVVKFQNSSSGLSLAVKSEWGSEFDWVSIQDIEGLQALKRDIEKQIEYRLRIEKEEKLNENKKRLKKTK
tara:strand:- start:55 stop:306 length:252 start_codon:yes stop_codon:yes gene_type:complete